MGSFFTRFETRREYGGVAGLSASDFVRYRARFGLETSPFDVGHGISVRARLVPQAGGVWHIGGDGLEDAELGLHEGFLAIDLGPVDLQLGRFEIVYGDHLVMGNVGWHHLGRSFDAARMRVQLDPDSFWVDLFFSVLTEGFSNTGDPAVFPVAELPMGRDYGAGDTYLLGLYAALGPLLGRGVELDVYGIARVWPATEERGVDRDTAGDLTIGVRTKGRAGLFDYRAEVGVQLGRRLTGGAATDVLAYQGDVELGLRFLDEDAFRVALEGFYASGDDPGTADIEGWDQLYPTAHGWMGTMDIVGARTNVAGGVLHLAYQPKSWLKLLVDTHAFFRLEKAGAVDSGYLGVEIDTGILFLLGKGFKVRGGYGIFLPDEGFADDPRHFVEVETRFDF